MQSINLQVDHHTADKWFIRSTQHHQQNQLIRLKHSLTHLPLDKMAAILADGILKCIFFNENFRILIKISLKFVPKGPMDNKSALV